MKLLPFLLLIVPFLVVVHILTGALRLALSALQEVRAARFAPATPSLDDVPDQDLVVEFLARAYRSAAARGDDDQLATIWKAAEEQPALRRRLMAVLAERGLAFQRGRAQA